MSATAIHNIEQSEMDNIQVVSDNIYTEQAFMGLVSTYTRSKFQNIKIAIFLFEKKWLDDDELLKLMRCRAEKVLIICSPELYSFIHSMIQGKQIMFGRYNAGMEEVRHSIDRFLNTENISTPNTWQINRQVLLTSVEQNTLELIIQGLPVVAISKIMKRRYNTVSFYKSNVMRKLGASTNAILMRNGRMYILIKTASMSY